MIALTPNPSHRRVLRTAAVRQNRRGGSERNRKMLINLSHLLAPHMPAYPGLPVPQFGAFVTHAESAERGSYAPGTVFHISTYTIPGNTGTYLDAPFHRHPDGADLAALSLDKMANLPGIVVQVAGDGAIGAEAFAGADIRGKAVLVHTGWAARWGGDYYRSGPFLTAEACQALVTGGAVLVGIDCANIDDMTDMARPAHTILLAAGIPIVEHLTAVEKIPEGDFRFFAVPPAVVGGATFPVRAFALI